MRGQDFATLKKQLEEYEAKVKGFKVTAKEMKEFTLKRAKKFVKKVAKTAAQSFRESFGFSNGVMLSVSGYAEYDLGSKKMGFGATLEGQACILGFCGDFTKEWKK